MRYYNQVTREELQDKSAKSKEKLKKQKIDIEPIIITGRTIAKTWWGKAWNKNLESYADYRNRISRGRSYVRNGSVIDLKIKQGKINALVQGSRKKPYKVDINIAPIPNKRWNEIIKECSGKIDSLQSLVNGDFPKELDSLFTQKGIGLFPSPDEIDFDCSCPDYAFMCKHVAATLYGIGAKLDQSPELFFLLRDANIHDLISKTLNKKSTSLLKKSNNVTKRVLDEEDVTDMFDL